MELEFSREEKLKKYLPSYRPMPLILSFDSILGENILLFLVFALLIVFALGYAHRKNKKEEENKEPLTRKDNIIRILTEAKDKRAKWEMAYNIPGQAPEWNIKASLSAISGKTIFMETNFTLGGKPFSKQVVFNPKMVGSSVLVHLRYMLLSGSQYYEFQSTLLKYKNSEGRIVLELSFPAALTQTQRRNFVRYTPPEHSVQAMAVWALSERSLPVQTAKLGAPLLTFKPGKSKEVLLKDISGSGIKLEIPKNILTEKHIKWGKKEPCILLLSLLHLDTQNVSNIWLAAAVRHTMENGTQLGCQFVYWAEHPTPPQRALHWRKVEQTGEVPPIFHWINNTTRFLHHQAKIKQDLDDSFCSCPAPKDYLE